MSPLFGLTVPRSTGLTVAKVAIEVEISVENVKTAPLNEPLWLLLNGHCNLPQTHAKGNEGKSIKVFIIIHVIPQAFAWQSFNVKYFMIISMQVNTLRAAA